MQKVVGSLSLQIATFWRSPRDFSPAVCCAKGKRFAELAAPESLREHENLRFAGLCASG
jgi:hypothetical protein